MDKGNNPDNRKSDDHCVYKNVATPGDDGRARIAAVADRETQCGVVDDQGICAECDESPTRNLADANVAAENGKTVIEERAGRMAAGFWHWRQLRWPRLACCGADGITDDQPNDWKFLAALSGVCLIFGLAGFVAQWFAIPAPFSIPLFAISYVAGGWDAAIESWQRLRRGQLDIHFLMLAVAAGAAAIGAWTEGSLLLFLFSASGAMEQYASGRTRREISALLRGAPKTAIVLEGDVETERAIESLNPGMRVRVRAGQQVPADVRVIRGESACDESTLTGEAQPVPKQRGDLALAGTLNLWGVIDGEVIRPAHESALQKIIHLIERAQHFKAPSQRFTDRFGTAYTWIVLSACAIFFLIGWQLFGWPAFLNSGGRVSALYRAMTLLVVASPCALVLSVPSAILSAIAAGAKRGVLFRGGAAIETLADIKAVALDKTGTLTRGEPELVGVEAFAGDQATVLQISCNLARLSHHPLSRAIQKVGGRRCIAPVEFTNVRSIAGQGISGRFNGELYMLGSREWLRGTAGSTLADKTPLPDPDTAEVWIGGPDLCGRLLLRDELRTDARVMIDELRRVGILTVMLTGDRQSTADLIAQQAGVDELKAQLLPEAKVAAVQELKAGSRKVAMIGDGVNDAPCLAAADVGVAMGARGSDAALEQAEVVLMNDRLENFLTAYHLSRRAKRVIQQNIAIALGTVAVMAALAIVRGIPLVFGVFAHEGSTVLVVLNSLRLLFMQFASQRSADVHST
jgi:Cd2+/Zn2+-exporting ATPase